MDVPRAMDVPFPLHLFTFFRIYSGSANLIIAGVHAVDA